MHDQLTDVHGAGAQRSDPKTGNRDDYPLYWGPQGDVRYVFNYVRCVRDVQTTATGINDTESHSPMQFILYENYPNPFNPRTTNEYSIPQDSHVILTIYNVSGQRISVLKDALQTAGNYSVTWNATGVPSGLYFCTLKAGGFTETRKMVVVR